MEFSERRQKGVQKAKSLGSLMNQGGGGGGSNSDQSLGSLMGQGGSRTSSSAEPKKLRDLMGQ